MKHKKHLLICLLVIGGVGLAYLFIPQLRELGLLGLVVLACPLMHLWMMKDKDHKH